MNSMCKQQKIMLARDCLGIYSLNFKTKSKNSILHYQIYGEMEHMMFNDIFREYSGNNRTGQVSEVKFQVKTQVI